MRIHDTIASRPWSLARRGAAFLRRHTRPLLVVATVLLLGAGLAGTAGAHGNGRHGETVETDGENGVRINHEIFSKLHFDNDHARVDSGDEITFVHADDTVEPHTATIVDPADLPQTFDEVFSCGSPGTVCEAAFIAHGDPPAPQVEAPGSQPGLDAPGDSLFFEDDQSITATVSAPPGTTLYYLCAIHPWMQGSIKVR
jgi:plastocyanin